MSKIKLEAPFQQFRGKVCKHSQIIFKEMYGTKFTSQICNPYTGAPSTAQSAQQSKMTAAVAKIAALSEQELQTAKDAFDKQSKYKTLRGYLLAQELKKS